MKIRPIGSNQTELSTGDKTVLFSYQTPVAANVGGKFYRTAQRWSVTTSKHINRWLDGAQAEERPQEWFNTLAESKP